MQNDKLVTTDRSIREKIYTIRGQQVMIDRDLAELYGVETRVLKQAVKRNLDKFPSDFMLEASDDEVSLMVSQGVIPSKQHLGGAVPYLFTEQGVSMLATVLKSDKATEISISIMRAFVAMRRFLASYEPLLHRLDTLEKRQLSAEISTDERFAKLFKALENKTTKPSQGIFYNGQIFDAYAFVNDLLQDAKKSVVLIDNYIDQSIFVLFSKYPLIKFEIYTQTIGDQLRLDYEKYQKQYKNIELKIAKNFHDRFLIIDDRLYHIGASLKDLGNKIFAFSRLSIDIEEFWGSSDRRWIASA